jgi:hypothetical protein
VQDLWKESLNSDVITWQFLIGLYRNKQTNAESEVKTGESTVSHNFTTHSYKWSALKGSGLFMKVEITSLSSSYKDDRVLYEVEDDSFWAMSGKSAGMS